MHPHRSPILSVPRRRFLRGSACSAAYLVGPWQFAAFTAENEKHF